MTHPWAVIDVANAKFDDRVVYRPKRDRPAAGCRSRAVGAPNGRVH